MALDLSKYKHIIWDWNGTLINDLSLCVSIINDILEKHKKPTVDAVQYKARFGFPVRSYYRRLGFVENFETVADEFVKAYNTNRFKCSLHDRTDEVLTHFKSAGINQHILSAYHMNRLKQAVEFYEIENYFNNLVGLENDYAGAKIDKGKELMAKLDCDPACAVVIGDTTHDFDVAQAIGADTILIANGHHSTKKLETCNVPVLQNLTDLLN